MPRWVIPNAARRRRPETRDATKTKALARRRADAARRLLVKTNRKPPKARGPSAQRPPSEQRPRLPPREPRQTYQGKKTLLLETLEWKLQHPTKVLLVRVGEFYEAWGIDATLLVEHCGLNPMGDKVRAGCPWRNLQQTLDGLTRNGLTVAVYEERFCADPRKKKVSSASRGARELPHHVQNQALSRNDLEWRCEGPQFVASSVSEGGASVICLDVDARTACAGVRLIDTRRVPSRRICSWRCRGAGLLFRL